MSDPVVELGGFGGRERETVLGRSVGDLSQIRAALEEGGTWALRGAGKSYGDACFGPRVLMLDGLHQITNWDPASGVVECDAGVTLAQLWRAVISDGWWLPVVTGTAKITVGGAFAMNVHGKNHWKAGCFAEHVLSVRWLTPDGELRELHRGTPEFDAASGSAGLLGVAVSLTIQLKKVATHQLHVLCLRTDSLEESLAQVDAEAHSKDYSVGWLDLYRRGRGVVHGAEYTQARPETVLQVLEPATRILGVSKSELWKPMRWFARGRRMSLVNLAKYTMTRDDVFDQYLADFSFLLDSAPGWERAYQQGGGFVQFQPFVPKEAALGVFEQLIRMQGSAGLVSHLAVLKRHRAAGGLFPYCVDGFSLAMDFQWREGLEALLREMTKIVLDASGKFYLAKDSIMTPAEARRSYGEESLERYREFKSRWDPTGVLATAQSDRLGLTVPTAV